MKILHIGKYFVPFSGGIENFMQSLITEQLKQGHSVTAIVHHHQENKKTSCINYEGVEIHLLQTFGHIPFVPLSWGFPGKYNEIVKAFQPDIIHIHCPNVAPFWGLFLPKIRKIPWVVHWHSDVLDNSSPRFVKMLYPFYRKFQDALLRKAKAIIATSPAYAHSSVPLKPYSDKITIIPLGLEPIANPVLPAKSCNSLKLLCVGRLSYYKGYIHLLQAFSSALEKGADLQLEIIGGGDQREILQQHVASLGLSARVKLLGQAPDSLRDEKLSQCDLLCLPSIERTEAFGLVLLEAMNTAKPCLVSDVNGSGMSWVVQDNKTGFVYKNGDTADLTRKLIEIYTNQEQLPIMGQAGRRRFLQMFQNPVIVKNIENLYQQILSDKISEAPGQ